MIKYESVNDNELNELLEKMIKKLNKLFIDEQKLKTILEEAKKIKYAN